MMDFVRSLQLGEKLSPIRNPDITWFYLFFPAFVAYIFLLSTFVNEKPTIGSIQIFNSSFDKIFHKGQEMEVISTGMKWSEGPLWIEDDSLGFLVHSDTILNRIFKWEEGKGFFTVGKTLMIEKSGCKSNATYCNDMYEPGSNGLLRLPLKNSDVGALNLLVCQHGERAISLFRENGTRQAIATHFKGRRLNSPNDLVLSPEGNLYFTDPKYGLYNSKREMIEADLPFSGIYMIRAKDFEEAIETGIPTKNVLLLSRELENPNGLGFSPDFSKMYVSNSLSSNAIWKSYEITDNGTFRNPKVFFNATSMISDEGLVGNPDGFKVDIFGNLFASGPGGVLVLSPEGQLVARFSLDKQVSNVAFGGDGRLYFTASDVLVRIRTKSKPSRVIKL